MAGYEQTTILGNLGRNPELRYTQSGVAVCSFSVAVTTSWNDRNSGEKREKTNWYKVSAWKQLGENCNQYLSKGSKVMIVGTVESRAYMNNAGEPASSLELTARTVQFLDSRGDGQGNNNGDDYQSHPDDSQIPF